CTNLISESNPVSLEVLGLLITLVKTILPRRGHGDATIGKACSLALAVSPKLRNPLETSVALYGAFSYHFARGDCRKAHEVAEQCLQLSETDSNHEFALLGQRTIGASEFMLGHFGRASISLSKANSLYDSHKHAESADAYGGDHKTVTCAFLAPTYFVLGR